jgi:hypothetical protein
MGFSIPIFNEFYRFDSRFPLMSDKRVETFSIHKIFEVQKASEKGKLLTPTDSQLIALLGNPNHYHQF